MTLAPRTVAVLLWAALLGACATRSDQVAPQPVDASSFASLSCEALYDEADRIRVRATRVAYAVDERFGTNIVALGVGMTVFWPALLAMRPAGPDAVELAQLKGRDEAVRAAITAKACPPPPEHLSASSAAALPIALGERLVYEERALAGGPARELVLRVTALRRDGIEFALDGTDPLQRWHQDPFGNLTQPPAVDAWVHWRRLLQPDMVLGSVLSGELVLRADGQARGRLRGQVIALGVQTALGRPFDAAVIELFGDAPQGESGNTRLDGVMVVDRKSGVLLRLELRSGSPDFALRRTLQRIEPAPAAAR